MKIIGTVTRFFQNHSNGFLTGTGIMLTGAAIITYGEARLNAVKHLEEKVKEVERPLSREEKIKETWKYYIIPTSLFAGSIGCHIACRVLENKKQAGLIAVATGAETAYTALRDQVKELGPRKGEQVQEKALQEIANGNLPKSGDVIVSDKRGGTTLMFSAYDGRWFRSSTEELLRAQNVVNDMILKSTFPVPHNEYWYEMGLNGSTIGELTAWDPVDGKISVSWVGSDIPYSTPEGDEPYLIVRFDPEPIFTYDS